jgi:ATP-dependent Clp protease adapter protein ClpS
LNIEAVAIIAAICVVTGIVLYVPGWLIAKRFVKSKPSSPYALPLSRYSRSFWIGQGIYVAIIFAGFSSKYWAPESAFGKFIATGWGLLVFLGIVVAIPRVLNFVRARNARRSFESAIDKVLAFDPVEAWTGGTAFDVSLNDNVAYGIELFNDDVTSMQFVVSLLCNCFGLEKMDAFKRMQAIHNNQSCVVGRLSHENALKLVDHIRGQAAKRNFPFRCEVTQWRAPVPVELTRI